MLVRAALLVALLLGSGHAAWGQVAYATAVTGTSGLLGYWRFDSSSTNSTVGGYTGSLQGDAHIGTAGSGPTLAGDPNNAALVLDGTGDYLLTNLTGGISAAGSYIAWVYLTAQPSTNGHYFSIAAQSQVGNDFDFQIQNNNNGLYLYTDSGGSVSYGTPFSLNTWTFVAGTFTANGTRSLYINGSLVASGAAGGHSATSDALSFGENIVFTGRYLQGSLDELAVFNRQLSNAEVAAIYAAAIPESGLTTLLVGSGALLAAGWRRRRAGVAAPTGARPVPSRAGVARARNG